MIKSSKSNLQIGNATGVFLGMFLGQAISLLIYIYIVNHGGADVVGSFGLGIQMCSLGLFFVDFGGSTYLTKLIVKARQDSTIDFLRSFSTLLVLRFIAFLFVTFAFLLIFYLQLFAVDSMLFMVWSLPGLFVYIFNVGGLLDGIGRQAAHTLTNSLYFLFPSLLLFLNFNLFNLPSLWYGIVFSGAVLLTTSLQIWMMKASCEVNFDLRALCLRGEAGFLRHEAREALHLFLSTFAGQFLNRGQIIVVGAFLTGPELGYFTLAKQIANGISQVSAIFRRIQLPSLISSYLKNEVISVIDCAKRQTASLYASIFMSVSIPLSFLALFYIGIFTDYEAIVYIFATTSVVIVSTMFSILMQSLVIAGRSNTAASVSWGSNLFILILFSIFIYLDAVMTAIFTESVVYFCVILYFFSRALINRKSGA